MCRDPKFTVESGWSGKKLQVDLKAATMLIQDFHFKIEAISVTSRDPDGAAVQLASNRADLVRDATVDYQIYSKMSDECKTRVKANGAAPLLAFGPSPTHELDLTPCQKILSHISPAALPSPFYANLARLSVSFGYDDFYITSGELDRSMRAVPLLFGGTLQHISVRAPYGRSLFDMLDEETWDGVVGDVGPGPQGMVAWGKVVQGFSKLATLNADDMSPFSPLHVDDWIRMFGYLTESLPVCFANQLDRVAFMDVQETSTRVQRLYIQSASSVYRLTHINDGEWRGVSNHAHCLFPCLRLVQISLDDRLQDRHAELHDLLASDHSMTKFVLVFEDRWGTEIQDLPDSFWRHAHAVEMEGEPDSEEDVNYTGVTVTEESYDSDYW